MIDLRRLAFDKGLGQKELGDILNIAQSQVSLMINGRRDITQAHIDLLIEHFGEDVIRHYIISDEMMNVINARTSRQVQATIIPADIVQEIKDEAKAEEALPYVSKELVQARDLDIRELVESRSPELQYKALSDVFGDVDYVQKVITSAMMPLFQPGDLLFVKFLPNHAKIISGAIYLIDTRLYGAMVRQVYVEDSTFRLLSCNSDYQELIIPREDIYSVGIVAHLVRSDFNMPSCGIPNHAKMMQNRDRQIDNLIDQIDKAGEREARLITIIENNH